MRETVYTPESPVRQPLKLLAEMGRDIAASRELAVRLFLRDFSAQYRQSALGYLWALAPPIIFAFPWIFLDSQRIINPGPTVIPYIAYVLAGTTVWSAFAEGLLVPLNSLVANKVLLTKVNFPREALIIGGLGQLVTNLLLRVLVMLAVLGLLGVPFVSASLWLAPLGLAALVIAGMSLGLLLAPVGLLYGDIGKLLSLLAGFWMIVTPVVYAPPQHGLAGWLARWNPASPLVATARDWFTGQPATQLPGFLVVTAASMLLLVVGMLMLRITLPMTVERLGS